MKKIVLVQKQMYLEIEIDDEDLQDMDEEQIKKEFKNRAEQDAYEGESDRMWDYGYGWEAIEMS